MYVCILNFDNQIEYFFNLFKVTFMTSLEITKRDVTHFSWMWYHNSALPMTVRHPLKWWIAYWDMSFSRQVEKISAQKT